jgi:Rod binding domain-containing protein
MTNPISATAPQALAVVRPKDDPAKVAGAAKQFEALLIGQMMKSMHDAESGWLGEDEDESASSAMDYGREVFAQSMAANGGFGLAAMVAKGLQPPPSD